MSHFRFEDASRLPYRLPDVFSAELEPYLDASGGIPNHSLVRCYGQIAGVTCTDGRPGQLMAVQTEGVVSDLVSPSIQVPANPGEGPPGTEPGDLIDKPYITGVGELYGLRAVTICDGLELCVLDPNYTGQAVSIPVHVIAVDLKRYTFEIILTNSAMLGDYLSYMKNLFFQGVLEYTPPGTIVTGGVQRYQPYGPLPPSDTDGDGDIDGDDYIEYGPIFDENGQPVYQVGPQAFTVSQFMSTVLTAENAAQAASALGGGNGIARLNSDGFFNKPGAAFAPIPFEYKNGWLDEYVWSADDPTWIEVKPGTSPSRIHFKAWCYSAPQADVYVAVEAQYKDPDGNWQLTLTSADANFAQVGNIIGGDTGFLLSGLRYRFSLRSAGALNISGAMVEIYKG